MNALTRTRQQYDWSFVILCIVAIFLFGVTATLAVCNTSCCSASTVKVRSAPVLVVEKNAQRETRVHQQAAVIRPVFTHADERQSATTPPQPTASSHNHQKKYRPYLVKPGESLSQLDPKGWQHTCAVNRQMGSIKNTDCTLMADATILLPVVVVESLTLATTDTAPPAVTTKVAKAQSTRSLDEKIYLVELARQQFCDHPGNEMSSACAPERQASAQLMTLVLARPTKG